MVAGLLDITGNFFHSLLGENWLSIIIGVCVTLGAIVIAMEVFRPVLKKEDLKGLKGGGTLVAEVIKKQGVETIFCLSGGHVAPVYCEAERLGIRVVDVRHEVNSAFAADALARLTGVPGVACVTAGPGVTNTVTAVQNAKMAESPVVIFGGATSTILKGKGSLQDIDHISLMKSLCKYVGSPTTIADVVPAAEKAFRVCQEGVPGPVFVELPMDLLYDPVMVLEQFQEMMPPSSNRSLLAIGTRWYVNRHLSKVFSGAAKHSAQEPSPPKFLKPSSSHVSQTVSHLLKARRPVFVFGSQAMLLPDQAKEMAAAVVAMGVPVFLAGMARGLLGANHPAQLHRRHCRKDALKQADVVVLFGVVCDFRLKYGHAINSKATLIVANRSASTARMNRIPSLTVAADACLFAIQIAQKLQGSAGFSDASKAWNEWNNTLGELDAKKDADIVKKSKDVPPNGLINPLHLCAEVNKVLDEDSMLVVDGGDFVGTAAYTVHPRGPLAWLDPGQFGTLGVGAGFAIACKVARPKSEVWIVYGDGALGFSIAEFDTFARNKMGVIAVIGNDAGWTQIVRDQKRMLGRDTACKLAFTDYHTVADGFGGKGFLLEKAEDIPKVLKEAKKVARTGVPVLINCKIARNDFREGSISV